MTKVKVTRVDGRIKSVESVGHSGFGREGEDIVCAALSSVIQTALMGLLQVVGINVDYRTDADMGYLKMTLPDGLSESVQHDADIILSTMLCGVSDLEEGYSDYIKLEVV